MPTWWHQAPLKNWSLFGSYTWLDEFFLENQGFKLVPGAGIEPARLAAGDFESPAGIAEGFVHETICNVPMTHVKTQSQPYGLVIISLITLPFLT